jgi:hypothetical protein
VRVVVPEHRNLHDAQAETSCQVDELHIEPEPIEPGAAEEPFGSFGAKAFEATLRVLNGTQLGKFTEDQPLDETAEEAPHPAAVCRLRTPHGGGVQFAAPDADVGALLQAFLHARKLFDGGGEIGVGEDSVASARC